MGEIKLFSEADSIHPGKLVRYCKLLLLNDEPPSPQTNIIGSLSKPRQRRQRQRHQTKGLMSRTTAVHVRFNSWYISLLSSAKQQHEMTKFCGVYETWTTPANISHFHLELNAVVAYVAVARL